MRVAYLDAFSGVSGDLLLGAVVDAGVPPDVLQEAIDGLGVEGLHYEVTRSDRSGIRATRVDVIYPEQQHYRHLRHLIAIVEKSGLADDVKAGAVAVFRRLAHAEAAVHGVSVEEVHFHEVGAADAIADVVGSVVGLHELGVERLLVGPLNVGSGRVACAHGVLPVPAPATAKLLEGWRCHSAGPARELTTPTGAALVTALGRQVASRPEIRLLASGWGAGGSDPAGWPNVLHVLVGETADGDGRSRPWGSAADEERRPPVLATFGEAADG